MKICIIAAQKTDIEQGSGNPFQFFEVSPAKHRRGYAKNWEVHVVKGLLHGMILSNEIMTRRRREKLAERG